MKLDLKLGTLPLKTYETRDYKTIEVGDFIDVLVRGKWYEVKIFKLYDEIPVIYFGEYV